MRPNKRTEVLDAALRLAAKENSLTIEGAAKEAGMTKQGVIYHFPSRRALLLAVQEHIARDWNMRLEAAAGAPAAKLSDNDKLRAYTTVAASIGKAELFMLLEAAGDQELSRPVDDMTHSWAPSAEDAVIDADALDRYLIRMASDGLWLYESLNPMPPGLRELVSKRLAALLDTMQAGETP